MSKLRLTAAAMIVILSGATAAQSQDAPQHQKQTKATKPPVAQTAAPGPDPVEMQRWFSGAVGDILNDTGRTLNNLGNGR